MTTTRPGPIHGMPMVGIHVTDTDRAVEFYRDTLGLDVVNDIPMEQLGGRMVILAVPGTDTAVTIFPDPDAGAAGTNTGIRLKVDDAHAWHTYLGDQGATVHEILEWPGVPAMFEFEDPDGNLLVAVS